LALVSSLDAAIAHTPLCTACFSSFVCQSRPCTADRQIIHCSTSPPLLLLLLLLLLDRASGRPLAFASCPYTTTFPHPGWAEQQPQDWWQALGAAVRDAVAQAAVPPNSIAAISLDTTNCTVVALDAGGLIVYFRGMLYLWFKIQ
jgi:hypothetical protein